VPRVLFIFGTRPEAIKLCPLIRCMRDGFDVRVCITAQHREMLDQVLNVFEVRPGHDLGAMRPRQTLFGATASILAGLEPVLAVEEPDMAVVQGDTSTTLCGALGAFYAGVPVAHVEAGLRTGNMKSPFPEEMNRVMVSRLAALHFAATQGAAENLAAEGVSREAIAVTGNTGIDALHHIVRLLDRRCVESGRDWHAIAGGRKLIAVTAHRRESFGAAFDSICAAVKRLAERGDCVLVYPVHPNPNVAGPARRHLENCKNVLLTDPLDYITFVDLMRHAHIVLTDSGGVQEEAPSLGKPVIVLRENTERPEAVHAGTVRMSGADSDAIVRMTAELLDDPVEYIRRSRIHSPYGDGQACHRIAARMKGFFEQRLS